MDFQLFIKQNNARRRREAQYGRQGKEILLRRYQDQMIVIGSGVILFGIWTVLKTMLYSVWGEAWLQETYQQLLYTGETRESIYRSMLVYAVIELLLRLVIGLSARAEGMGRRRGGRYTALITFFIAVYSLVLPAELIAIWFFRDNVSDLVVSLIIDATSWITMIELRKAVIQTRRIRKELEEMPDAA